MRILVFVIALAVVAGCGGSDTPTSETPIPAAEPYELKGDRLGMSLEEFKKKYHRVVPYSSTPAPFCNKVKGVQGVVRATVGVSGDEHFDEHYKAPTVAGIKTTHYMYSFVDEKLYNISIVFNQSGFVQVHEALLEKYGEPVAEQTELYQNRLGASFSGKVVTWSNGVSEIVLSERFRTLDDSTLLLLHTALSKRAQSRLDAQKPGVKDL